jgi:hypothetical protein
MAVLITNLEQLMTKFGICDRQLGVWCVSIKSYIIEIPVEQKSVSFSKVNVVCYFISV